MTSTEKIFILVGVLIGFLAGIGTYLLSNNIPAAIAFGAATFGFNATVTNAILIK